MNCLYITSFFNLVAVIIQTFIKSWNQLLYPGVTEICRLPFDQRCPTSHLFVVNISPTLGEFTAPLRHILPIHNVTINRNNLFVNFRWTFKLCVEKSNDRTYFTFSETLNRLCLSYTSHSKWDLPLSKEHGSEVQGQVRRQCCHYKLKISLSAYT
jgi:hypothetical protein